MRRLLVFFLIFLLLSGCGSPHTLTVDNNTEAASAEPEVSSTEDAHAAATPEAGFLQSGTPLAEAANVSELNCTALSGCLYPSVQVFSSKLLVVRQLGSDFNPVLRLTLVDPETGLASGEADLDGFSAAELLFPGTVCAVADGDAGHILLLDETLSTIGEYWAEPFAARSCALSPDGSILYTAAGDRGIRRLVLSTGAEELLLPNAAELQLLQADGCTLVFSYTDTETCMRCYAMLDGSDGTITVCPLPGDYTDLTVSEGCWLGRTLSDGSVYSLGSDTAALTFRCEDSDVSLLPQGDFLLLSAADSDSTLFCLYTADGTPVSACQIDADGGTLSVIPLRLSTGLLLLQTDDRTGTSRLLFWDIQAEYSPALPELSLLSEEGENTPPRTAEEALYARAEDLQERFGIAVLLAEECSGDYGSFTAELCSDAAQLTAALDALESALSAYPEGFFAQLCHDTVRSIEINLTGALHSDEAADGAGFAEPQGFAMQSGSRYFIVMDCTQGGSLTAAFHHELAHVIDARLAADARLRSDSCFSEENWASLNPEGFCYAGSYTDLPEDFFLQEWDGCFIDDYSRTFPAEDRARIWEYAMTDASAFAGSECLQEKLLRYCEYIRDCFDTDGWPERTVWEQALAQVQNSAAG